MQRFTDLLLWQRSHALTLEIYRLTTAFPNGERFGLISQMRRAALSVPTNIAEGSKRVGKSDFARFLNIAEGSLAENGVFTHGQSRLGLRLARPMHETPERNRANRKNASWSAQQSGERDVAR